MDKICIELENGDKINLELYKDKAPKTVENFLKLVDENFFEGLVFHRVIKNFMSQGGGFYINGTTLKEKSSNQIYGEFKNNGWTQNDISHELGVISMARAQDPNSASSQFFLCDTNAKFLDGNYAAFGKAIDEESIKNIRKLNEIPTRPIGGFMTDFPNSELENFKIKRIFKI